MSGERGGEVSTKARSSAPGLEKVTTIEVETTKPDAKTTEELSESDNNQEIQEHLEHKLKVEELASLTQDRKERKTYANRIYWLIVAWLAMLFIVLGFQGFKPFRFEIGDKVLITLITGTTLNVIGIFLVVANYLFPRPPSNKQKP